MGMGLVKTWGTLTPKYHPTADILFSVEIIRVDPVRRPFLIKKAISQQFLDRDTYRIIADR
jgi:hypothetical protein